MTDRSGRLRRAGRRLLLALALVGALAAALLAVRRPLAARMLRSALSERGIEVVSLEVADLGLARLRLTNLSLAGGALTADEVVGVYDVASLRAGRVLGLTVAGGALRPARLPPTAEEIENPALLAVQLLHSIGRLTLRDATVVSDTSYGEVVTRLDGEIAATEQRATAALDYTIASAPARLSGSVSAAVLADGRVQASVAVDRAAVMHPGAEIGDLRGKVEVAFAGARLERAHVELDVREVQAADPTRNFGSGRLRLDLEAGGLAAVAALRAADLELTADATLREHAAGSILRVDARAIASATAFGRVATLPRPVAGHVLLRATATASLGPWADLVPLDLDALRATVMRRIDVDTSLEVMELSYPGRVETLTGNLHVQLTGGIDQLHLRLVDDARLVVEGVDAGWLRELGVADVVAPLPQRLELQFPARTNGRLAVSACEPDGWQLDWSGVAHLVGRRPDVAADLVTRLALEIDGRGGLERVRADNLVLRATGLTIGGTRLESGRISGNLMSSGDDLDAFLDVELAAAEIEAAGAIARTVALRSPLRVVRRGIGLDVSLRAPGSISAAQLVLPAGLHLTAPVQADLARAALERRCSRPDRCVVGHRGTLAIGRIALATSAEPESEADLAKLGLRGIQLDWRGTLGGTTDADLAAENARLELAEEAFAAAGLTARLAIDPAGAATTVAYTIASLRELGDAPLVAPLERVRGSLHGDGARFELDGEIHVGSHGPFSTRGHYLPATRSGELALASGALELVPGRLAPADLFPDLAHLRDVRGRAEATMRIATEAGLLSSELRLRLADFSARIERDIVEGLETELYLDSLFPPSGPGGQVVRIRRITSTGEVALEDAVGNYAVVPGPPLRMVFASFAARFAGGEMTTDDLVLSPIDLDQALLLQLTKLDLAELFKQTKVEGLSGSGRLTGKLPVLVIGKEITISDGRLEATEPGVLRYESAAARAALAGHGQYVDLLVAALREFHYKKLSISLDTQSGSRVQLRLQLDGSNPEVLDGYPFHINIAIGGDLSSLLDALNRGYGLREDILRKSSGR